MDTATSDIRAVALTPSSDGDSPILPELLEHIPGGEETGAVTAHGPMTRAVATPPGHSDYPHPQEWPTAEGRLPDRSRPKRNLLATRHNGRAFWKRWAGYHLRSRIEAKMRCL